MHVEASLKLRQGGVTRSEASQSLTGAFDIRWLRADSLIPRTERSVCRSSVGLPSVALLDHHIPRRGPAIRFLQVPVDLIAKPVVGSHLWSAERRESFTVKLTARQTCRTRGRCFAKRQLC